MHCDSNMTAALATVSSSGYTNFPKATLSYRWVITDAKFLQYYCQQSRNQISRVSQTRHGRMPTAKPVYIGVGGAGELESPLFDVSLPCDHSGKKQDSTWCLSIRNGKLFLCQKQQVKPCIKKQNPQPAYRIIGPNEVQCLSLPVQAATPVPLPFSKFCILDCVASFLGQKGKVRHEIKVPNEFYPFEGEVDRNMTVEFGEEPNVLSYLIPGEALVIQVTATLLFYANPINMTNTASVVPPDNVAGGMKFLFENKLFADLTIKCGDKEFEAHKAILASQSPVFKRMFEVDMKEKHCGIIEVSDITPKVMSDLLTYLYTGNPPNLDSLTKELLAVANKYELPRLLTMCENELMMNVTLGNVIEILVHAEMHQASNLKRACLKLIKSNSTEVYKSDSWKEFRAIDSYKTLIFEVFEFCAS